MSKETASFSESSLLFLNQTVIALKIQKLSGILEQTTRARFLDSQHLTASRIFEGILRSSLLRKDQRQPDRTRRWLDKRTSLWTCILLFLLRTQDSSKNVDWNLQLHKKDESMMQLCKAPMDSDAWFPLLLPTTWVHSSDHCKTREFPLFGVQLQTWAVPSSRAQH